MFVGSFFRVKDRAEAERGIPSGSGSTIIFVENENKLYEKNRYGMLMEYNLNPTIPTNTQLEGMDKRLQELEESFKKLSDELGGITNEI